MIKAFATLILTIFTFLCYSQQEFTLLLKGQIFNSKGTHFILKQQIDSKNDKKVAEVKLDDKGFFEQSVTLKDKDYYTLELEDGQSLNLIVEGSDTINVYGDGRNIFKNSNILNSEPSMNLLRFMRIVDNFQAVLDSIRLEEPKADDIQKMQLQQRLQTAQHVLLAERRWFISENLNSPAILGAISTINVEQEFQLYETLVKSLNHSFGHSPTTMRIYEEYERNKQIMETNKPLSPGSIAKEISLPSPGGDTLNLSDYKGKVVLIDFWASWCGPCRRENPNVVNIYNKYKDKGFEIFSVSLDKSKDSWVQAIEQDGLIWDGHVSDLKFWQSQVVGLYQVSSIPFTVLIDADGKIIATNLRGQGLANKLSEIFD